MILTKTILLALLLAAGGCSVMDYKTIGVQPLKNAQGHVIGHKETLRNKGRTIIVHSKPAGTLAAPSIEELKLVARLDDWPTRDRG